MRAASDQIETWFGKGSEADAIAVIGGAVSGNLEIIDFDVPSFYGAWREALEEHAPELFSSLPIVATPSGGYHVYIRHQGEAAGNLKLAWHQGEDGREIAIETRGEGGYALAPPSRSYKMVQGKLVAIPTLSDEDRTLIFDIAYSLNEAPEPEPIPEYSGDSAAGRPGDEFNARGWDACRAALKGTGWHYIRTRSDGTEEWRRPGKKGGLSATFNGPGACRGRFYVFSSNAVPFDSERSYAPFGVYALLEHGGDFKAAAKDLASGGYGAPPPMSPTHPGGDGSSQQAEPAAPVVGGTDSTWPYLERDGQIVYQYFNKKGELKDQVVCDFVARIDEEIIDDEGDILYRIKGRTMRGRPFTCPPIAATVASDDFALKKVLGASVGGGAAVHTRMSGHLSHAIHALSKDIKTVKRYTRTGWKGDRFLLPGMVPDGVEVDTGDLKYGITGEEDETIALDGLASLMQAHDPMCVSIMIAHVLAPPFFHLAKLSGRRYCLHMHGMTQSLKTEFLKASMSIWGSGFSSSENLIKWGEGATSNRIMFDASHCHDLPFPLDNFKPSTGGGVPAFVALIHNILEGGDKRRLNSRSEALRVRKIRAWPFTTGEDLPQRDTASIGRLISVHIRRTGNSWNAPLARAIEAAEHMPAIGRIWIEWLQTDEAKELARQAGKLYEQSVKQWLDKLAAMSSDSLSVRRVANNIAVNHMIMPVILKCPKIGEIIASVAPHHEAGLMDSASRMVAYSNESREGIRFLQTLSELLASGNARLLAIGDTPAAGDRTMVGWYDFASSTAYVLPTMALELVLKYSGKDGLGGISSQSLWSQLDELGVIKEKEGNRLTRNKWLGDRTQRVLWLDALRLGLGQMQDPQDTPDATDDFAPGKDNDDMPF